MLKGEVFGRQLFENQIFALFINTFLNGNNGVCGEYLDGMEVTYSGSNITIDSGAVCIQGRFLEEDAYTTLNAGTSNLFCKLVIEIDLDKTNTDETFNQGYYKIIKDSSDYPTLTQTDIVNTNSGVYQYELARFKTSLNGISDFVDTRTYLDVPTIYDNVTQMVQDAIDSIEDGSAFALKANMVYSTNEVDTGQVWIDGKPIYRKTFSGGTLNGLLGIDISDLSIDNIFFDLVHSSFNWRSSVSSSTRWAPLMQTSVSNGATSEPNVGFYQAEIYTNNPKTKLYFNYGKNMVVNSYIITIEYTKTTD